MNGDKKRRLFKRKEKQAEEAMKELISLSNIVNLFGDKSQTADEIDPSIFKGLYNPFQQGRSLDPITGMPFNELTGTPTEPSDWFKKEKGLVKDPDTGEWYKPDFPLGSAGGQPTYNPEFHKEMQREQENSETNMIQKEGNRLREYLKKLIEGSKKSKDERADLTFPSQRDRPGVQYV